MLDEKNVYAQDSGKNNFLTMTKEQILTAIMQAVSTGEIKDIDAGFITKIQEMNDQNVLKIWVGTMAEFEELQEKHENMLYLFTDDPTVNDIEAALNDLDEKIDESVSTLNEKINEPKKFQHNLKIEFKGSNSAEYGYICLSIIDSREEPYTKTNTPRFLPNAEIVAGGYAQLGESVDLVLRPFLYAKFGSTGIFHSAGYIGEEDGQQIECSMIFGTYESITDVVNPI